eukprot:scaffold62180_cov36-Tisochrysis_lutea.AAC.1
MATGPKIATGPKMDPAPHKPGRHWLHTCSFYMRIGMRFASGCGRANTSSRRCGCGRISVEIINVTCTCCL